MFRFFIVTLTIYMLLTSICSADMDSILYCNKYNDEYKQIQYFAKVSVSIDDYDITSGDSEYLKLKVEKNKIDHIGETDKKIKDHFFDEFQKLVKGTLPYYDVDAGREQRVTEFLQKNKFDTDTIDEFRAYEIARMKSLYGKNPAALYCNIRISRKEFPVLYVIKTNLIATDRLENYDIGGLQQDSIGYSSPKYIVGEINKVITDHLSKISSLLKKIKSCKTKE